jgi:hypothetical protein
MKQILMAATLLFTLSACQHTDKKSAEQNSTQEVKLLTRPGTTTTIQQPQQQQPAEEKGKLAQMGITADQGKIIIDTNKTRDFFKQMAQKIQHETQKLSQEMQQGVIEEGAAGIEVNQTHINIDLNKTEHFLDIWSKKLEEYVKEFDTITNQFDTNTQKDNNATY